MKTVIKTSIKVVPPKERDFPKLMISKITGAVILAAGFGPLRGVIVHQGGSQHAVGFYFDGFSMASFEDFIGTVTIKGK